MKPPAEIFLDHILLGESKHLSRVIGEDSDIEERYKKLAQQFAKVMAISDKYQSDLVEMADHLRRSKEDLEGAHLTLRQSEERFRALTENLPVGVVMIDADLQVLAANPKMREWFPDVEADFSTFCRCQVEDRARSPLHRIWREAGTHTFEREIRVGDAVRYLRVIATGITGSDGKVEAVLKMVEDITEHTKIEQERKQHEAREREHQKTESLHRMASAIAHHFNNQLHIVMGHLELALDEIPADNHRRRNLEDALQSARTAAEMSVLMRRYVGEGIFSPETIDLAEVCRERVAALRKGLPQACRIEAVVPESGPNIRGKPDDIAQIVTSLVTNAREACDGREEGVIEVRLETIASEAIPLPRCFPVGYRTTTSTMACLTVSDNGHGIAGDDIDKIFEPFFSRKFTGRGIGLALVAGLIRGHDGAISVESVPGQGTVFRCYFPCA